MPVRPFIGFQHIHLLGKLLDHMDDEAMKDAGFTKAERNGASELFDTVDVYLTEMIGQWDIQEALV